MSDSRSPSAPIYAIGGIFFVYGVLAMVLAEFMMLVGLQGARPGMYIWPAFVFTPVIPAVVALSGRALMRGSSWAYGAALLWPLCHSASRAGPQGCGARAARAGNHGRARTYFAGVADRCQPALSG